MVARKLDRWARDKVASVFYDTSVGKIWFHLGGFRLDGKELAVVAKLIQAEKIACYGNVPETVLGKRDAQYNFRHNAILLSPRVTVNHLTVLIQSIILHEGVHVFIDYRKLTETTFFHNEAVAYVVQALFLRDKGAEWPSAVKNDPIVQAVEDLLTRFKMTSNRAWLNWVYFEPLMKVIQAHKQYLLPGGVKMPWNTLVPADGIAKIEVPKGASRNRTLATTLPGVLGHHRGAVELSRTRGPLGLA